MSPLTVDDLLPRIGILAGVVNAQLGEGFGRHSLRCLRYWFPLQKRVRGGSIAARSEYIWNLPWTVCFGLAWLLSFSFVPDILVGVALAGQAVAWWWCICHGVRGGRESWRSGAASFYADMLPYSFAGIVGPWCLGRLLLILLLWMKRLG